LEATRDDVDRGHLLVHRLKSERRQPDRVEDVLPGVWLGDSNLRARCSSSELAFRCPG